MKQHKIEDKQMNHNGNHFDYDHQMHKKNEEKLDSDTDYNQLYFKEMLNIRNYRQQIQRKLQELNQKRTKIYQKVVYYEKKSEEEFRDYIRGEAPQRKKRNRRNADEIDRQYTCPTCSKKYGSEGSLHQHMKLKHPQMYEANKRNFKRQAQNGSQNQDSS